MIDVQVSPELMYVLRVAYLLFNVAGLCFQASLNGHYVSERKGRWFLFGVMACLVWLAACAGSLYGVTTWYAQLAELRGW